MTTRNPRWDRALRLAQGGALPAPEIAAIREALARSEDPDEEYLLIQILGQVQDTSSAGELERCAMRNREPLVAGIALRVLCVDLGMSSHYTPRILELVRSVDWDDEDDARLIAIQVAGEHLRRHQDQELLTEVISIAEDELERELITNVARDALARALGAEWRELRRLPNEEIMERARRRLG